MEKNVIICGGSGLIGKALCKSLINYKINIINFDQKINPKIKNNYKINLSETVEIKKAIKLVIKKFKKVDALVNCIYPKQIKTLDFLNANIDHVVENISHHTSCFLKINKEMCIVFKKQNYGSIINFGSIYGSFFPREAIYKKTEISETQLDYILNKNLLIKFSKFLASKMKSFGTRVNIVSPGGVYDKHSKKFTSNYGKFTSSGTMLNPNDLVEIVYFLISDSSKNITGQNILVDDGFTS
jgi:NAD(P)-dependent dehydrogenase (short-subunit alcohol dehydrogenase family)